MVMEWELILQNTTIVLSRSLSSNGHIWFWPKRHFTRTTNWQTNWLWRVRRWMPTRRAKSKQNQWKCAVVGEGDNKSPPAPGDERLVALTHKARNAGRRCSCGNSGNSCTLPYMSWLKFLPFCGQFFGKVFASSGNFCLNKHYCPSIEKTIWGNSIPWKFGNICTLPVHCSDRSINQF